MTQQPRCRVRHVDELHRCELYDGHAGYHAARVGARWLEWFTNRAEVRQP